MSGLAENDVEEKKWTLRKKEELKSERSIVIGQSRTEDRATVFTIIGL